MRIIFIMALFFYGCSNNEKSGADKTVEYGSKSQTNKRDSVFVQPLSDFDSLRVHFGPSWWPGSDLLFDFKIQAVSYFVHSKAQEDSLIESAPLRKNEAQAFHDTHLNYTFPLFRTSQNIREKTECKLLSEFILIEVYQVLKFGLLLRVPKNGFL